MAAMRLDRYDLGAPIGRGGAGTVWRATSGTRPVAIKVVWGGPGGLGVGLRGAVLAEVAAMARLDHPAIAAVLDHGLIREADADASDGELPAGAPYVVMELAASGLDREPPPDWAATRAVLRAVLGGLAHAHAREVVHRDVKPANVLLAAGGSWGSRVRIADFGLALALEHARAEERVYGSPGFMAPEQILGRWRDFGPWTDLYAVGCLAWSLVTGAPPFGVEPSAVQAHLVADLPPLRPRFNVPVGLLDWVAPLLDKDAYRRPLHAADVARALDAIPDEPVIPAVAHWGEAAPSPSVTLWLDTLTEDGDTATEEAPPEPTDPAAPAKAAPAAPPAHAPVERARDVAALGLIGLQAPPIRGREDLQDALWTALSEAIAAGAPRGVVLRGPEGAGKSRLARWVLETASELGVAHGAAIVHGPGGGPEDGLGGLLRRWFRASDLPLWDVHKRVRRRVDDPGIAEDLAAVIAPGEAPMSPAAAHAVAARWFARLAADRPLVLHVDDAQFSDDSVALCAAVLDAAGPVLVVVTLDGDVPAALAGRADVRVLEVGSLDAIAHRALVASLAPLHHELVEQLAERTLGNPLFAVRLVASLARTGRLVPTPDGRLAPRGDLGDTDSLAGLSTAELAPLEPGPRRMAEIAAALGTRFDLEVWRAACATDGGSFERGLVALVAAGVVRRDAEGWGFPHAVLRETLAQEARRAGRWAAAHGACAAPLLSAADAPYTDAAGRARLVQLARHLAEAGDPRGPAVLLRAAEAARIDGRYLVALDLLDRRDAMLPDDPPVRAEGDAARAWIEMLAGRVPDGAARAARTAAIAESAGLWSVAGDATWLVAEATRVSGDSAGALPQFEVALAHYERAGVPEGIGHGRRALAGTLVALGRRAEARPWLEAALSIDRTVGPTSEAASWWVLGQLEMGERRFDAAEKAFRRAYDLQRDIGSLVGRLVARNAIAEAMRRAGRLAEGAALVATSVAEARRVGFLNLGGVLLNQSQFFVAQGRVGEARALVDEAIDLYVRTGRPAFEMVARYLSADLAAAEGDLARFDDEFGRAEVIDQRLSPPMEEVPETLARAADRLETLGEAARAARAREAAARHAARFTDPGIA